MTLLHDAARAAAMIRQADSLIITAGAGMGVDSGLPDFRGDEGFWKAYPLLGDAGMGFRDIASPSSFRASPALAWGFYGHRLQLYRDTAPHEGFEILRRIGAQLPGASFVFTSNVDGHFQRSGFPAERVVECHGSIHHLQCVRPCSDAIWPADGLSPAIDAATCSMTSPLPRCPGCGTLARPNILMFNDGEWIDSRTERQYDRFARWRAGAHRPVVIELGAGTDIPTVRRFGEGQQAPLVRINPRAPGIGTAAGVGLAVGALAGLRLIRDALGDWQGRPGPR